MTILKEKLSDFKEKIELARQLIEECKTDGLEPYRNHYRAREIYIDLETKLQKFVKEAEDEHDKLVFKTILGHVQAEVGKINLFVEETNQAEAYLNKSLDLLQSEHLQPESIIISVETLNHLGILWSKLQDNEKSKEFLLKSEQVVKEFKEAGKPPLTIFDVLGTADEVEKGKGEDALEKSCILTYFYLAQVYGTAGDLEVSGKYCHLTLKRQFELNDYEHVDWFVYLLILHSSVNNLTDLYIYFILYLGLSTQLHSRSITSARTCSNSLAISLLRPLTCWAVTLTSLRRRNSP